MYDFIFLIKTFINLASKGTDSFKQGFDGTCSHHTEFSKFEEKFSKASLLQLWDSSTDMWIGGNSVHECIVAKEIGVEIYLRFLTANAFCDRSITIAKMLHTLISLNINYRDRFLSIRNVN